jgi:hypothetical protein
MEIEILFFRSQLNKCCHCEPRRGEAISIQNFIGVPVRGGSFFAKILVIFYEKMQYGLFFIVAKPFCEF